MSNGRCNAPMRVYESRLLPPMNTSALRLLPCFFLVCALAMEVVALPPPTQLYAEKFQAVGNVEAVVPLANGQVIIGGDFETVNGMDQRYIARLNADGTLDSSWQPGVDFPVIRLVASGDEVYMLGGLGQLRRAALSGNGQLDPEWVPAFTEFGRSNFRLGQDIAVSDGFVYLLVDNFPTSSLDGVRLILARCFRAGTGATDRSWTPKTLQRRVTFRGRLLLDEKHVYVARSRIVENTVSGTDFERFAITGSGKKDPRWSTRIRGQFEDVAQDAAFIYLVGTGLELASGSGRRVGRISKATAKSDAAWPERAVAVEGVRTDIVIDQGTAFVAGGGSVAAIPLGLDNPTGLASYLEPLPANYRRLAASGGAVYALASPDDSTLERVLRVDAATGAHDSRFETRIFRPAIVKQVLRLPDGTTFVGGRFDVVGDIPIVNLARFEPDGTLNRNWTPNPVGANGVEKMFVSGNSIYLHGSFFEVAGKTRFGLARVSLATPLKLESWDPVSRLQELANDVVFIVGAEFSAAGAFIATDPLADTAIRLRRIPLTGDGIPDPGWNADLTDKGLFTVKLEAHAGFLYAAGLASAGIDRYSVSGNGTRDPRWKIDFPRALPGVAVRAMEGDDDFLYVALQFDTTVTRYALDGDGTTDPGWRPSFRGQPAQLLSLLKAGPWLYVSGRFDTASGDPHLNVARIGPDGTADPEFDAAVLSNFAAQSGPLWVAALGDSPVLGGTFSEISGVRAFPPVVFNSLPPPVLTRSGTRVFATLRDAGSQGSAFFRITAITGGSLATSTGASLAVGSFVTVAEGNAGLDFTADPTFDGRRSIALASASAAEAAATGGESAEIDLTDAIPPRSRYTMAAAAITVREGSPSALVAVRKIGPQSGRITFAVEQGVARAGEHFAVPPVLTLDFPAGDGTAVVSVPLLDDTVFTGNKNFRVVLTGATDNGILLAPTSTLVTIQENDPIGDTSSLTTLPAAVSPPPATASLRVDLNAVRGAWRLLGETSWHGSGETLTGLTRGNYFVEFRLANGFIAPPDRTVPVDFGENVILTANYLPVESLVMGALSVSIEPATVANASGDQRGQWRLIGETAWRDSGATAEGLPTGPYEVEFKPVPGRKTPPPQTVNVAGAILYTVTGTYLIAESANGAQPQPLTFDTVKTAPYAFVGQVQTALGFASGTAVRSRVVLTVAHALFDDVTLSAVTDARWYHQKARGEFEPPPQVARGWFIFEGYASQRSADLASGAGSVGISTVESQRLDVAALWFLEPCARGAFSGYLRTDASNDWLLSSRRRILAGYPVEEVPENRRGVMHATDPNVASTFTRVNEVVRATTSLNGSGGMSGGPFSSRTPAHSSPQASFSAAPPRRSCACSTPMPST